MENSMSPQDVRELQAEQSHVQIQHLIIQKLCFVNAIIIRF